MVGGRDGYAALYRETAKSLNTGGPSFVLRSGNITGVITKPPALTLNPFLQQVEVGGCPEDGRDA